MLERVLSLNPRFDGPRGSADGFRMRWGQEPRTIRTREGPLCLKRPLFPEDTLLTEEEDTAIKEAMLKAEENSIEGRGEGRSRENKQHSFSLACQHKVLDEVFNEASL